MKEDQEKEIGGHTYTVKPLPAIRGLKLFNRVVKMIGPSFGIIVDGLGGAKDKDPKKKSDIWDQLQDADLGADFFERAAATIGEHVKDADLEFVCKELASHTTVIEAGEAKGAKLALIFDRHFAGDMTGIFRWMAFALSVNFGDFSGALTDAATAQGD